MKIPKYDPKYAGLNIQIMTKPNTIEEKIEKILIKLSFEDEFGRLHLEEADFWEAIVKISQLLKEQRKEYLKEFRKWFKSIDDEIVEDAIERILNK